MPIEVLLVEDNPGDARLMQEVLRETNKNAHLHLVTDGAEAIEYLGQQGRYVDAPRPDIILLDLNLPKVSGLQVLVRVKEDPRLKTIPLIILTTSKAEEDIQSSYHLLANCYLTKPSQLKEFEELVVSLNDFWLTKVALPQRAGADDRQAESCV